MVPAIALAMKLGVPQRFARAAAIVLLVLAATAALLIAKSIYDGSVVDRHEEKAEAALTRNVLAAERSASRQAAAAEERDRARSNALQKEIEDARQKHPEAVRGSSGPAANAALRGLRDRQPRDREAGAAPNR